MFPETGKKHALYRTTTWHRNTRRWIKREAGRNTPTGLKSEKTRTAPNHTVAQKHKKMDKETQEVEERSWEHVDSLKQEKKTRLCQTTQRHRNTRRWREKLGTRRQPETGKIPEFDNLYFDMKGLVHVSWNRKKTRTIPNHNVAQKHKKMDKERSR